MSANAIGAVERQFDCPRPVLLRARTEPRELSPWRGSPGWHGESWEKELTRLHESLDSNRGGTR